MKKTLAVSLFCLAALAGGVSPAAAQDATGDEVRALIINTRPLAQGRKNPVLIRFEHIGSGLPVMKEEAQTSDKAPVYLLVADAALSDFQIETPQPMNRPGEYIFTMTPRTECGYRIWAGADTIGAGAFADIPGAQDCSAAVRKTEPSLVFEDAHYRFSLSFDTGALQAGKTSVAKLSVRKKSGGAVDELEPIMGTYGFMTGVYDDFSTLSIARASGETPSSSTDRGGPVLEFQITPEQPGFLNLFVKTIIDGAPVMASFGTPALPAPESSVIQADSIAEPTPAVPEETETKPETENPPSSVSEEDLKFEQMLEDQALERVKEKEKRRRNDIEKMKEEQNRYIP